MMHKLKNKHTGEVITTPYLAEVEEYLKSGDYEMSENKYPAIFQPDYDSEIKVLVYGQYDGVNAIHLDGKHKGAKTKYTIHGSLKNITREYLMNTYGKCESQEHADFICKLAENHGFELNKDYTFGDYFYICKTKFGFGDWQFCSDDDAKLISLPLPPKKESKMPEEKPVYTKEMQERGEFKVGMIYLNSDNQKCELKGVNRKSFIGEFVELLVNDDHLDISLIHECKPIPTIEDELIKFLRETPHLHPEARARKMLELYNITPKEK